MDNSDNLNKENILSVIYRYFPKNIKGSSEQYWKTKEFLNLKNKCEDVRRNSLNWNNFFDCLREYFPYYLILDQTQYVDYDRCYSLVITFKNELSDIKYFEVFVSYIIPSYMICLTETTGNRDFKYNIDLLGVSNSEKMLFDFNIIKETLLEFFPYQKIDESIGKLIINDIAFQNMDFGDVNIYKAIYTNNIFYTPISY